MVTDMLFYFAISLQAIALMQAPGVASYEVMCIYKDQVPPAADKTGDIVLTSMQKTSKLCTQMHYIYAPFSDSNNSIIAVDDHITKTLQQLVALKQDNPSLKVILGVGGIHSPPPSLMKITKDLKTRRQFAVNLANFVRTHGLDGVNIDWNASAIKNSQISQSKRLLTTLCQELRTEFTLKIPDDPRQPTPSPLLLMVSVSPDESQLATKYEPERLKSLVDFIVVKSFGYYGSGSAEFGHDAPVHNPSNPELSQSHSMNLWISAGMPKKQLILSVSTTATAWKHTEKGKNGAWMYSSEVSYTDVCSMTDIVYMKADYNAMSRLSTSVKKGMSYSYDDSYTMKLKCRYIKTNAFAGAALWTLTDDDMTGQLCQRGSFPLTTALSDCLLKDESLHPYRTYNDDNLFTFITSIGRQYIVFYCVVTMAVIVFFRKPLAHRLAKSMWALICCKTICD